MHRQSLRTTGLLFVDRHRQAAMLFSQIPQLQAARPAPPAHGGVPATGLEGLATAKQKRQGWRGAIAPPPLYDRSGYDQGVPPPSAATVPRARQSSATRIFMGTILSLAENGQPPGPWATCESTRVFRCHDRSQRTSTIHAP